MLQDVNRGSANSTGWNSIIGSFVISKLNNNVRVMRKLWDVTMQLTCLEEKRTEIFAEDI